MGKISFLVVIIFIFSCSEDEKIPDGELKIKVNLDDSTKGKLSEVAESIEYILLDCPEEHPLVWPHNLKFDIKGNIYLRDIATNQLFVFDSLGEFKMIFSSKGMGPEEYFQISDFQVSGERIIIFDSSINKIIEFDLNGEFVSEQKIYNKFFTFFSGQDFILNFSSYNPDFNQFNFIKTNLSTGDWKGFVKIPDEKLNLGNFDFPTGFMEIGSREEIYYNIPFSTDIAHFESNSGEFSGLFHFDFGKFKMPVEYLKLDRKKMYEIQEEKNLVRQINSFFPFKDFYFLNVAQGMGKKNHVMILNRKGEIKFQKYNLENDLDNMKIMGYPWSFTKEEIVYMVSSVDFLNEYSRIFMDSIKKQSPNNIHSFVKKYENKLKEDTRVLVKIKLKSFG